jgi:hypothetical protein
MIYVVLMVHSFSYQFDLKPLFLAISSVRSAPIFYQDSSRVSDQELR